MGFQLYSSIVYKQACVMSAVYNSRLSSVNLQLCKTIFISQVAILQNVTQQDLIGWFKKHTRVGTDLRLLRVQVYLLL